MHAKPARHSRDDTSLSGRAGHRFASGPPSLLIALVVVACGGAEVPPLAPDPEPSTMLDIVTDAPAYAPEDDGTILARCKVAREIHVDLCTWESERWTGQEWELAAKRPDVNTCLHVLRVLQFKQTALMPFTLPQDLTPGDYRFRFERIFDADSVQLPVAERVSLVFRIEP